MGEYYRAIELYQQRLELAKKIKDSYGQATALFNIGQILSKLERHSLAIEALQISLKLFQEIGLHSEQFQTLQNLVNICHKSGSKFLSAKYGAILYSTLANFLVKSVLKRLKNTKKIAL